MREESSLTYAFLGLFAVAVISIGTGGLLGIIIGITIIAVSLIIIFYLLIKWYNRDIKKKK